MANTIYKLSMVGVLAIIIFGVFLVFNSYNSDIYPLDRMRGHLNGIAESSDPDTISAHLIAIQIDLDIVLEKLPTTTNTHGEIISKNPVRMFPTESTNFLRIQNDVNYMLTIIDNISSVPKYSSAHHTEMVNLNDRSLMVRLNIMDAIPYMFNTPENILSNSIWLIGLTGMTEILLRRSSPFLS